jgi:DNA-binding transcriptional ArsR family regulator
LKYFQYKSCDEEGGDRSYRKRSELLRFRIKYTQLKMAGRVSGSRKTRKDIGDLSIPEEIADSLCSSGGIKGLVDRLPPEELVLRMQAWYQACADPARLKILSSLRHQPLCVCVIKNVVKMADSRLSYHLTILRKAGLIEGDQQGYYIIYRITPEGAAFIDRELLRFGFETS